MRYCHFNIDHSPSPPKPLPMFRNPPAAPWVLRASNEPTSPEKLDAVRSRARTLRATLTLPEPLGALARSRFRWLCHAGIVLITTSGISDAKKVKLIEGLRTQFGEDPECVERLKRAADAQR